MSYIGIKGKVIELFKRSDCKEGDITIQFSDNTHLEISINDFGKLEAILYKPDEDSYEFVV